MEPILDFLANPTTRRLGLTLLGPLVAVVNKKTNMGLEPEVVMSVIAGLASAVVASNWKEVALAKAEATGRAAAERMATPDDVVASINKRAEVTP